MVVLFLLLFLLPIPTISSNLALDLDGYDFNDLVDVSKLCHVAYGEQRYAAELEDLGWSTQLLTNSSHTRYGIVGTNGPLKVVSFMGTTMDLHQIKSDLNAVRKSTKTIFPTFDESTIHKGIYDYYAELGCEEHFSTLDEDQLLIFSGHSLGGACANIAGLRLTEMQAKNPHKYPEKFCSILTFGAPPILGKGVRDRLNSEFRSYSHVRFSFENDPVVKLTRTKEESEFGTSMVYEDNFVFVHGGEEIELGGNGLVTHSLETYISSLKVPYYSPWRLPEDQDPIYHYPLGNSQLFFKRSDIKLLNNLRSIDGENHIRKVAINQLKKLWWGRKRRNNNSYHLYYPNSGPDLLFYQLWRFEELGKYGPNSFNKLIDLLDEKYQFFDRYFYRNTFFYFDRIVKNLVIETKVLEDMLLEENRHRFKPIVLKFIKNYLDGLHKDYPESKQKIADGILPGIDGDKKINAASNATMLIMGIKDGTLEHEAAHQSITQVFEDSNKVLKGLISSFLDQNK